MHRLLVAALAACSGVVALAPRAAGAQQWNDSRTRALVERATPRLGEGDGVRAVPDPLSPVGLEAYDFAISDSLAFNLPGRSITTYEVKVRPKNDRLPRIIGAMYIERDEAQVVRMAFNFTRAAF